MNFLTFSRRLIMEYGTAIARALMVPEDTVIGYIVANQYLSHISAILREIMDHSDDIHPEIASEANVYPLIRAIDVNRICYKHVCLDDYEFFSLLEGLLFVTQDEIKRHACEENWEKAIIRTGYARILRLYVYDPLFKMCVDPHTAERVMEFLTLLEKVVGDDPE